MENVELICDETNFMFYRKEEVIYIDGEVSIGCGPESELVPGYIDTRHDASDTPMWAASVGQRIERISVLGWWEIPRVIQLSFQNGSLFIGSPHCLNDEKPEIDQVFFADLFVVPSKGFAEYFREGVVEFWSNEDE